MDVFKNISVIDIVYGDVNIVDINGKFIYKKRHIKFNLYESCFSGFTSTFTSNAFFWRIEFSIKMAI